MFQQEYGPQPFVSETLRTGKKPVLLDSLATHIPPLRFGILSCLSVASSLRPLVASSLRLFVKTSSKFL